jgi:predicted nucleic acid-binding protein
MIVADPSSAPAGLVLVDTSAYEQIKHSADAAQRYTDLAARGLLATCGIVSGELLYSMSNAASVRAMRATLDGLWYLRTTDWAEARALEVMMSLAQQGKHRAAKIGDLHIAAIAEHYNARLLHYDHAFEDIASLTGQRVEWIVPRGAGHAQNG